MLITFASMSVLVVICAAILLLELRNLKKDNARLKERLPAIMHTCAKKIEDERENR